jgi:hypothetical protein
VKKTTFMGQINQKLAPKNSFPQFPKNLRAKKAPTQKVADSKHTNTDM